MRAHKNASALSSESALQSGTLPAALPIAAMKGFLRPQCSFAKPHSYSRFRLEPFATLC